MRKRMGVRRSVNFIRSLVDWSDLIEMIKFPWGLKLAATTFMWFDVWLAPRATFTSATILLGSGLRLSGIPLGRNCATNLKGWWEEFGLDGCLGCWAVGVGSLGLGLGGWL